MLKFTLTLFAACIMYANISDLGKFVVNYGIDGRDIIEIPDSVTLIEEPTGLPSDDVKNASLPTKQHPIFGLYDLTDRANKGIRFFKIGVKSQEKIKIMLKVMDQNQMRMRLIVPKEDNELSKEIIAINKSQKGRIRQMVEFKNKTNEIYYLYLHLSGPEKYPYRVEIDRK